MSCSSFCCATTTAADCAPVVQIARVGPDDEESHAAVQIVITTAAAVSASSSDEPESSAMSDDHESHDLREQCKAAAHWQIVEINSKKARLRSRTVGDRGMSRGRIAGFATSGRRVAAICDASFSVGERERERDPRAAVVGHGPTRPLWVTMIFCTRGRPRPVPRALVVKNGRNIRSATDGGNPGSVVGDGDTKQLLFAIDRALRNDLRRHVVVHAGLERVAKQVADGLPQQHVVSLDPLELPVDGQLPATGLTSDRMSSAARSTIARQVDRRG